MGICFSLSRSRETPLPLRPGGLESWRTALELHEEFPAVDIDDLNHYNYRGIDWYMLSRGMRGRQLDGCHDSHSSRSSNSGDIALVHSGHNSYFIVKSTVPGEPVAPVCAPSHATISHHGSLVACTYNSCSLFVIDPDLCKHTIWCGRARHAFQGLSCSNAQACTIFRTECNVTLLKIESPEHRYLSNAEIRLNMFYHALTLIV